MRLCLACMLLLALGCGFTESAEVTGVPRVALIYSDYGDFRHRDDYDGRMADLAWPMDKYENRDFGKLMERLGEYDIILGSALFNYSNIQDFAQYRDQLLAFMARGGAMVWTDANYEQHVNWLKGLGKDWAVTSQNPGKVGIPAGYWDAAHPVFSIPNRIPAQGGTWSYMEAGDAWQVISKDEEDRATGLFRTHGRGYMMLTCYWSYSRQQLENLWGALRCHRAGLLPTLSDFSTFGPGDNEARASVRNITADPLPFTLQVTVNPPRGEPQTFAANAQIDPGATAVVTVTVPLEQRGAYTVAASLQGPRGEFLSLKHDGPVIPDLLTVDLIRPLYRRSIYQGDPPPEIEYAARVHPWKEDVANLQLRAWVRQGDAPAITTGPMNVADMSAFQPSLKIGRATGEPVTIHVDLAPVGSDEPVTSKTLEVPVFAEKSPRVTIDDNLATRIDGEPYFPIAIYHVGIEHLPRIRDLGFNSFQGWGSTLEGAGDNLDAAQKLGLKVLLEMSTLLRGDEFRRDDFVRMVETYRDHPALLCWYTVDEPEGETMLARCREAREICMELDPYHPVYLVMCSPGSFERFGTTTDILAVDPYPIPNSVTMVSNWMRVAQDAVQERRPIWIIPQLHNTAAYHDRNAGRYPTPEEERNMVYQGLIWGAKGVVYYPWDDTVTGLIHDPALLEAVGKINRELAVVGPETLLASRTVTAANDETNPNLYAAVFRGEKRTLVIAASVADEPQTMSVPVPGMPDSQLEVLFEDRQIACEAGVVRDHFAPLQVHVYATPAGG
ncbi:MAG: hypothetical protein KBI47_02300 [Armatimonadetes bacterium]|nr:hypothetical protein [Armatimonadota bacterium]MDI9583082.1 hypothetical protein [Acidobacteriota bacterium]